MQIVNIHEAKARFSRLVDAAASGEEIIIAKAGKPTARLVPIEQAKVQRCFGRLKGKVSIGKDFDAPLPFESLTDFEGNYRSRLISP